MSILVRFKIWQCARKTNEHMKNICARGLPIVVVYTMGATGSSSLTRSVSKGLGRPAYHFHNLTPRGIAMREADYKTGRIKHLSHVVAAGLLRKRLDQGLPPEKLKIVTSVRDPVAHRIAAFFRRRSREPDFPVLQERD